MPVSRYKNNNTVTTSEYSYKDILKKRDVSYITHLSFKEFKVLRMRELANIDVINHTWESNDRFFKLSTFSEPPRPRIGSYPKHSS